LEKEAKEAEESRRKLEEENRKAKEDQAKKEKDDHEKRQKVAKAVEDAKKLKKEKKERAAKEKEEQEKKQQRAAATEKEEQEKKRRQVETQKKADQERERIDREKIEMEEKDRKRQIEETKERTRKEAAAAEIRAKEEEWKLKSAQLEDEIKKLRQESTTLQNKAEKEKEKNNNEDIVFMKEAARKALGMDCVKYVNFGFSGGSGDGKSTLINAVRGRRFKKLVKFDDSTPVADRPAIEGANETTTEITCFNHPNFAFMKFWDMPGGKTISHPEETYFMDKTLYAFDTIVIFYTGRFESLTALIAKGALNIT
jgi:hypothetical protein